jgi:hypothetical protein
MNPLQRGGPRSKEILFQAIRNLLRWLKISMKNRHKGTSARKII